MGPGNLPALTVAKPDVCVLANNHVLDFGRRGLEETLVTLAGAGLPVAGAGRDADEAQRAAAVPLDGGGRVLVVAAGMPSSGVPASWAAGVGRSGVAVADEASEAAAASIVDRVRRARQPGDLVVASLHWGSNWGYDVPRAQVRFAHTLIDGGVDVVHGHSSHHPRPIGIHGGRLVLFGCGDLVNDYEGIGGHERYRSDLRLLHLVSVHAQTGELIGARMIPLRARRLRLEHAAGADVAWLRATLDRVSRPFGAGVDTDDGGALTLELG
jgi:poly-gamma-glutamate capsule biosynthesis protein CapA/YwtB (metallophosphatase superfamily)